MNLKIKNLSFIFFILMWTNITLAGMLYLHELSDRMTHVVLDNGFEAVLIESHSAPVIASVAVVQTGLRNESIAINGVSHCLEHMLFNGTMTRTQEELYNAMDLIGGYYNASTSDDYTNYLVLAPKEKIESAMEIQADMLFNSIFPEEKLEKERAIIIEEMGQNLSQSYYLADLYFKQIALKGTPYAMPVLGSVQTIENLAREQILDYYKTFYVPNNIRALFIGDFKRDEMIEKIDAKFGSYPPGNLPTKCPIQFEFPRETKISRTKIRTQTTFIHLMLKAPGFDNPDFYPYQVLTEVMNSDGIDGMKNAVNDGPMPAVFRISTNLDFHPEFSTLTITAMTSPKTSPDITINKIMTYLKNMSTIPLNVVRIDNIRRRLLTSDAIDQERPHHFGIVKSQQLAVAGFEFFANFHKQLALVQPQDLVRVANEYFSSPVFIGTIAQPIKETVETKEIAPAAIEKKTLPDGCTVIVQQSTGVDLLALHVLVKNRSIMEPPGKEGIVEFLHRMLPTGTSTSDKKALSTALERIGAQLKLFDEPMIPFDDYYTSTEYSYIRLQCLDEYTDDALTLLCDIMQNPAFNEQEIENVRSELINLAKEKASSAPWVAEANFYQMLAPHTALAGSIYGTEASIRSITRADLEQFKKRYFAANNLIVSVVSSLPVADLMSKLEKTLTVFPNAGDLPEVAVKLSPAGYDAKKIEPIGKPQSYLYLGQVINEVKPADRSALYIANAYLSSRVAFELREKQGLAYRIGTGISFFGDQALFYVHMGTRPENIDKSQNGILDEIKSLQVKVFTDMDLQKTISQVTGSMLLRLLTGIGQAYYLGLGEFKENDHNYYQKFLDDIKHLDLNQVQAAAQRFSDKNNIVSIAR